MITEEIVIAAPKLSAYLDPELRICPACGVKSCTAPRRLYNWLTAKTSSLFSIAHCPGGKALSENAQIVTPFGSSSIEVNHNCAGILEPHLHLKCNCCGYQMLSRAKAL